MWIASINALMVIASPLLRFSYKFVADAEAKLRVD